MDPNSYIDFTKKCTGKFRTLSELTNDASKDLHLLEDENRIPSYEDATDNIAYDALQEKNFESDNKSIKPKAMIIKQEDQEDKSKAVKETKYNTMLDFINKEKSKLLDDVNKILENNAIHVKFSIVNGRLESNIEPKAPIIEEAITKVIEKPTIWKLNKRTFGFYEFTDHQIIEMISELNPSYNKKEAEAIYDKEINNEKDLINFLSGTKRYSKIKNMIR